MHAEHSEGKHAQQEHLLSSTGARSHSVHGNDSSVGSGHREPITCCSVAAGDTLTVLSQFTWPNELLRACRHSGTAPSLPGRPVTGLRRSRSPASRLVPCGGPSSRRS